jgi:hypothetical protein
MKSRRITDDFDRAADHYAELLITPVKPQYKTGDKVRVEFIWEYRSRVAKVTEVQRDPAGTFTYVITYRGGLVLNVPERDVIKA